LTAGGAVSGAMREQEERVSLHKKAEATLRPYLATAVAFSLVINLSMLVAPIYMLQVYDRVLTASSIATLVWISLIALVLIALYAVAEGARRRALSLGADAMEATLRPIIVRTYLDEPGRDGTLPGNLGALNRVQGVLSGGAIAPLLDAPFMPLFFGLLFVVHPLVGVIGLAGGLLLVLLAFLGQRLSKANTEDAERLDHTDRDFASGMGRQRSAIVSMGMAGRIQSLFADRRADYRTANLQANCTDGYSSGWIKSVRQMLQVGVLGAGAALAIHQEMSAGAIVAASILMGRALAPIDQLAGGWRTLSGAMIAWRRLNSEIQFVPADRNEMPVPTPEALIEIEDLAVGPPGAQTVLIRPFTLQLTPGSLTVLIGPNGAGKSTLLRTLIGVWPPAKGEIRFGGRSLHTWSGDDRGRYVGYLPQEIELLPGTVRDNIARFDPAFGDEAVFAAAAASGAHDAILRLPDGYDTRVGPGGIHISPGQAQLIALARAFAGHPRFVALDEPTSNLDHRASNSVVEGIKSHANSGAALLVSTHDPRLIRASHSVLALDNGRLLRGKPDDFLAASTLGATRAVQPAEGGAA